MNTLTRTRLAALPAPESLTQSADTIERLAAAFAGQPGRLPLWKLVTASVEAYHALQSHIPACTSPRGALAGVLRSEASLAGDVGAIWAGHDVARKALNGLIIAAQIHGEPNPEEVATVRAGAIEVARLLRAHDEQVSALLALNAVA